MCGAGSSLGSNRVRHNVSADSRSAFHSPSGEKSLCLGVSLTSILADALGSTFRFPVSRRENMKVKVIEEPVGHGQSGYHWRAIAESCLSLIASSNSG